MSVFIQSSFVTFEKIGVGFVMSIFKRVFSGELLSLPGSEPASLCYLVKFEKLIFLTTKLHICSGKEAGSRVVHKSTLNAVFKF